ncbi:S8 family serine peptidase, partial [Winogradskyella sp.]|nr:S8 family serine peptidase [Winogradskyella sp.]
MKKISFYFLCFFVSINLQAQNKYTDILNSIKTSYDQNKLTSLSSEFSQRQARLKEAAVVYARLNNIPIRYEKEDGTLLELQYITEDGTPIYYTTFNVDAAISTRTNFLNTGGGLGLALNGDDLTAHVWDGGLARATHQEYDGAGGNNRFSVGDLSTTLNFHAAHVTGTIMASGVVADAKGMAWQADAVGYDWNNDESEAAAAAAAGMLLSNHSYGYRLRDNDGTVLLPPLYLGGYTNDSRNWDDIMYNAPYYLMVVAAGNDGYDDTANTEPLGGASAFDKLSGHATSKNNLVVANANDALINLDGTLQSVSKNGSSSEGPTDDYRIKPDITGNGTGLYSTYESADDSYNTITGTSMASPNVMGSLLLLQEHYFNLYGTFMRAATLKGLALHTADDAGVIGPDANFGWGLLNTKKAAETLTTAVAPSGSAIVKELTLNEGETYQITIQSNGFDPLLASISWTDIGGTVQTVVNDNTSRLVNDLDVRLTNGTAYTPWKLTGVDSNGKGDNTVDPYERIDIDGASGVYTLTVSHKGSLNTGSQNFSLIVSGIVVATTPVISYSTTSSRLIESTNCNATLVTFPLNIAQAPSANATVNFTVNSSSTATNGLDFEIMTPSIVFPSGITNSINLELNIYNDGFIEGDETIIIDFNVVTDAEGDASADLNANTLTLTLTDDDIVPTEDQIVSIYSEDMEEAPYGVTTNNSGNGSSAWGLGNASVVSSDFWSTTGNSTIFAYTNDDACNCDKSNDLLTTEEFSLDGLYSSATLTFDHAFSNVSPEIGDVLVSTGGAFSSVLTLSNTSAGDSRKTTPWVNDVTVDMTPYIGEAVVLVQFRYNDGNAWSYGMAVDNISISAITPTLVQTTVNEGLSSHTQILSTSGTIYTSDSLTGDVMLDITNNNQADDYGCIDVSVTRSGTGAQSYNGSSNPDFVMDKTFAILTDNTIGGAGSTSMTFYFTEAEIAGWESATSNTRANLVVGREIDGVITEVSLATIGSFATNVTLSADFSDVKGTYVFGDAHTLKVTYTYNNGWLP